MLSYTLQYIIIGCVAQYFYSSRSKEFQEVHTIRYLLDETVDETTLSLIVQYQWYVYCKL